MNYDAVTIQDCIEAYEIRGWVVFLENGQVTGFEGRSE